jgi:hypothetical protein
MWPQEAIQQVLEQRTGHGGGQGEDERWETTPLHQAVPGCEHGQQEHE